MKKLLFTLLGLAAALTLPAQDFKITHGPWLCDMTEDGVTVLWTTNKPALSWVEATEDDGRSFYAAEPAITKPLRAANRRTRHCTPCG